MVADGVKDHAGSMSVIIVAAGVEQPMVGLGGVTGFRDAGSMAPGGRSCKGDELEQHESRTEKKKKIPISKVASGVREIFEMRTEHRLSAPTAGLAHVLLGASSGFSHRH